FLTAASLHNQHLPMKELEQNETPDELLSSFILAGDLADAELLLSRIITQHAQPLIESIIKSKLSVSLSAHDGRHLNQDALEISSDVKETLLAELRKQKSFPERRAINNFQSYVAVIAFNACHDYLRRKYPQRHSLKN